MIIANIILWSIVSAVWAGLAWWKVWLVLSSLCTWWGGHREASS
nr:MAG TPA: hypothetical protein [Caudoviricetes sp.]